jgi:hypothetical protein
LEEKNLLEKNNGNQRNTLCAQSVLIKIVWEGGPCEVGRWLTSPAHEIPSQTGMKQLPYIILHLTRAEAGTAIESLGLRYKG